MAGKYLIRKVFQLQIIQKIFNPKILNPKLMPLKRILNENISWLHDAYLEIPQIKFKSAFNVDMSS